MNALSIHSYFFKDTNQITVFTKTGCTFMRNIRNQFSNDIKRIPFFKLEEKYSEHFGSRERNHYISVRDPFSRFVSGFVTIYNDVKKENSYYKKKLYYPQYKFINESNDLVDAFLGCHKIVNGDWSFDQHTINVLNLLYINQMINDKNLMFIPHTNIGKLFENHGMVPDLDNYVSGPNFTNKSSQHSKNTLKEFIVSDKTLNTEILDYLNEDIEIYQNFNITEI